MLHQKFDWHILKLSTNEEVNAEKLSNVDGVFLMLGTEELMAGTSPTSPNRLMIKLVKLADEAKKLGITVVCGQLPPVDMKNVSGKIALTNYKLSKLPEVDIKCLVVDVSCLSKYDFVEQDGFTLSNDGSKSYCKLLNSQLDKIEVNVNQNKCQETRTESSGSSIKIFHEVKSGNVGKIIGKGGHVIKKLASDHNVFISVGKWYEKVKGSDKHEEISDALTIVGAPSDISAVVAEINEICDSNNNK